MSKTIGELSQQFSYINVPEGTIGVPLKYKEYTRDEIIDLVSEEKYQRLISASALKKQGVMNWSVLLPMVIAVRPESVPELERGSRVIDGQHKGIKYLQSKTDKPYTCCVIEHPEGWTLEQCEEEEARIFTILNTKRKKLTKLDEIRAGVIWKQPEALWVQEVLLSLNLKVDGLFGSDEDDAKELKGFYQFWFLTVDYNSASFAEILKGYKLWVKMFNSKKDKHVNGTALRAIVFLQEFLDKLQNGRKLKFYEYITEFLPKAVSQDGLVKPYTDRKSNKYVLYYILDTYKEYCRANGFAPAHCIGDETLKDIIKVDKRFSDPRL
tara:strand:- start:50 stop:1021 length:972 start_codon:yes stop_codon:yes gene_type:complete